MRISREQILDAAAAFIIQDVLPRIDGNPAVQIVLHTSVNAIRANTTMTETVFQHDLVKILLQDDGTGLYETGALMDALYASVQQYGALPLTVPPIPLISPKTIRIKLSAEDVARLRSRLEAAAKAPKGNGEKNSKK